MTTRPDETPIAPSPWRLLKLGPWAYAGLAVGWAGACIAALLVLPRRDGVLAIMFVLLFVPLYLVIAFRGSSDRVAAPRWSTRRKRDEEKAQAVWGAASFGSGFIVLGTFVAGAGGPGGAACVVVGLVFVSVAIARKRSSFEDEPQRPPQHGRV